MTTLHLGVLDVPYGWGRTTRGISAAKAMRAAQRGASPSGAGKTTGDVAEILEARYGLFSAFVRMHEPVIQHDIEQSIQGGIETALMGGPRHDMAGLLASATTNIEETFKDALTMQSYDYRIPGVPTGAALRGVSHRFKRPYARRDPRPSFIDTGLLQASFKAWVTG
jgi:hypothetical protein